MKRFLIRLRCLLTGHPLKWIEDVLTLQMECKRCGRRLEVMRHKEGLKTVRVIKK